MPEWEEQAPLWARLLIPVGLAALLAIALLSAACERPQPVAADATCSPKADAEFAANLALKCKGEPLSECPEADAIGDEYERKAELECSQQ